MSEGLFSMEPVTIEPGDHVRVQTIYGHELGLVLDKGEDAGFPTVTIRTFSGDKITIGVARVEKVASVGPRPICPTKGCVGDARYAAPGRGHEDFCKHPMGTGVGDG